MSDGGQPVGVELFDGLLDAGGDRRELRVPEAAGRGAELDAHPPPVVRVAHALGEAGGLEAVHEPSHRRGAQAQLTAERPCGQGLVDNGVQDAQGTDVGRVHPRGLGDLAGQRSRLPVELARQGAHLVPFLSVD